MLSDTRIRQAKPRDKQFKLYDANGLFIIVATTAAMRFFETEFPDVFSWLLNEMGELPLPRKRRKRVVRNPLKLITVPA